MLTYLYNIDIVEDGIRYEFIPTKILSLLNIKINNIILKNDVFEKYDATTEVKGELIVCKNISIY